MAYQAKKLSILLPVFNEGEGLKIMVHILEATVEAPHEILVIYDFPEDNSVEAARVLQKKYSNVILVHNDLGRGVSNAIKKGVSAAEGDVILITAVDEVFPIAAINHMLRLITEEDRDFVSCTRYALGGKRLGGSFVGGILSRSANWLFRTVAGSVLTDTTTGMKMMKKSLFDKIVIEAGTGWAFAFEIAIKAQILGLKFGEVPVVSIDRLFGGDSSFKLGPWTKEYMKWFIWGGARLNRFKRPKLEVVSLDNLGKMTKKLL